MVTQIQTAKVMDGVWYKYYESGKPIIVFVFGTGFTVHAFVCNLLMAVKTLDNQWISIIRVDNLVFNVWWQWQLQSETIVYIAEAHIDNNESYPIYKGILATTYNSVVRNNQWAMDNCCSFIFINGVFLNSSLTRNTQIPLSKTAVSQQSWVTCHKVKWTIRPYNSLIHGSYLQHHK